MQIPDEVRHCVAFLAYRKGEDFKIGGTTFFVSHPIEDIDAHTIYAITASHVIADIRKYGNDGIAYCRVNTKEGGSAFRPLSDWILNNDNRIDVAVAVLPDDFFQTAAHLVIPSSMFLAANTITNGAVMAGDDIFFPGLFSRHAGEKANIPIVRVGNIAAVPNEDICTEWGYLKAPCLVKRASIGGLSGSPVFWQHIIKSAAPLYAISICSPATYPSSLPTILLVRFGSRPL